MNRNTKSKKRAEHKAFGKLRQQRRFHNRAMWLNQQLERFTDATDAAIAKAIGWSVDKLNKYRYGAPV